jgi:outer membrane immunogenic protein
LTDPTVSSVNQNGWLFGGFAGAQKQWGNWVLGIEADFDGADINGSTSSSVTLLPDGPVLTRSVAIDAKIDELCSVRGKVGFAAWQNWLFYGTGGLAFAHVQDTATVTQTGNFSPPPGNGTASFSGGESMLGWAAGAGIDWKYQIDPGSAVVLGVEYLRYQFGSNTLVLADNQFGSGNNFGINTKESVDTIKGRISYLFSIH